MTKYEGDFELEWKRLYISEHLVWSSVVFTK